MCNFVCNLHYHTVYLRKLYETPYFSLISVPKSTIILYDHLQVFSSLKNINFRIICNRYGIMRLYKIHEFLCFSKIYCIHLYSIFICFCPKHESPLPEDFSVQTKVSSSLYQMVPAPLTVLSVFWKDRKSALAHRS